MKVLVYSSHGFDKPYLNKFNKNHQLVFTENQLNVNTVNLSKNFEAISVFTSDDLNKEVLEKLNKNGVKYITLRCAGYDNVDLDTAKKIGIKVANVPAYSPNSVAEHAVALLLCLNRKILLSQQLMHKNDFRLDNLIGFELKNKTVGIIGTGKIGASFAKIMNGFGSKLIAYDIVENELLKKEVAIKYMGFEDACKKSDIISIHCPLNENTRYMFNKKTFSIIKNGAVIINTARGQLINTLDLIEALKSNKISAAGLDVYEHEKNIFFKDLTEKPPQDSVFNELRNLPNVIITGHQAFLTYEALTEIAQTTLNNLNEWQQNNQCKNDLI